MRKEKKTIEIGGIVFDLVKGQGEPKPRYWSLFKAYDKPSLTKIEIMNYWNVWHAENTQYFSDYIGISSCNCMMFTLCGVITVNDVKYGFYITKIRKEVWLIE